MRRRSQVSVVDVGSRPRSLAPKVAKSIFVSSLLHAGALSWLMAWLEKSMVDCVAVLDSKI